MFTVRFPVALVEGCQATWMTFAHSPMARSISAWVVAAGSFSVTTLNT